MVLETQKSQTQPLVNGISPRKAERRTRQRAALQWVVYVARAGGKHRVNSRTSNVSSQGFYCLVQEPFEPGERVECTMVIPVPKSSNPEDVLWLRCQAKVLRVDVMTPNTTCGIAFQIEEYSVVHVDPMQISPAERMSMDGSAPR